MNAEPASRRQTMHEHDAIPPTQSRQVHPFAYNAQRTPPFSALAGGRQTEDMGGLEGVEERGRAPKPDSEVLSRGAGMRSLSMPQDAVPGRMVGGALYGEVSQSTGDSPGAGTFGREASQEPVRGLAVSTSCFCGDLAQRIRIGRCTVLGRHAKLCHPPKANIPACLPLNRSHPAPYHDLQRQRLTAPDSPPV